MAEAVPAYKRVLLKVSGEALGGESGRGLDFVVVGALCRSIKACVDMGVQMGVVTGGGNYWRGVKDGGGKMERSRADQMGMLATMMNSIALAEALEQAGVPARVMTNVDMPRVAESYCYGRAMHHLERGRAVIFACGSGNPYFSTDTGAALRAAEIDADVILLAKNIDGVYDSDPAKNPDAKKYDDITYSEVLAQQLQVMDTTATSLCMDNNIPVFVFALKQPENIYKAAMGENIGTYVHG
mgnify:CR=1 FL=1